MRTLLLSALVGAGLFGAACGESAPADASVVRSDSAGVRIVTSTGPDTTLPWRLEPIGVFRDSLGEPWLFTGLSPQTVLTDRAGRTYVLEQEPAIRRFGRDGTYERSIGRKGGAPGEMQSAFSLVQQGDSLAVIDFMRSAIVRWGPELEPIADLPLRDGLERVSQVAFRSGGLWVQRFAFDSSGSRTLLFGDSTAGEPLLSLEDESFSGGRMLRCGDRMQLQQPMFFAPTLRWIAQGPRMLANVGPDYELKLYEGNRLLASVRRAIPERAPTIDDLRRLYPEGMTMRGPGITCTIPLEDLVEGALMAPVMPQVHGLALLSDGTIWVQRSLRGEKPPALDVFGSDGAYVGTLSGYFLPVGLLPNGELLLPADDEDSGGVVITRLKVTR